MLVLRISFAFCLVVASQCLARTLDVENAGEKRGAPAANCNRKVQSENIQMVPLARLQTRDFHDGDDYDADTMLEARHPLMDALDSTNVAPGMLLGTRDLQERVKEKRTHAAAPYLGYNGETVNGHQVFGGTNSTGRLIYHFFECESTTLPNYRAYTASDGTSYKYGQIRVADTGLCLQPATLAERNQDLVEGQCDLSDNSGLFYTLFEYRSRVKTDTSGMRTTVTSLRFLGRPKGDDEDFPGTYKLLYDPEDDEVKIDYQENYSDDTEGEEVAFIFPQRRSGK